MNKGYNIIDGRLIESTGGEPQVLFYTNPDETEKKYLVEQLNIDEHTLLSALDPDEISRVEFPDNHIAFIFKRPKKYSSEDRLLFKTASVGFFLFKNLLIVVTSEEVKWLDSKLAGRIISPTDLLLRLMDRSIFHFLEHLKVINLISDEIEQKINQSMENRYLINLFVLEKSLVFYLNAITANGAMLEKLRRNAEKIGLSNEEIELLDDTIIENNQCYKQAEIYSNILANLMDARASIVGNNLNILMKTLNIITIAIMVPTFVVSAFSMNVRIPLQDISIAFYIVMFLGALSTVVFILFWKYRKW